MNSWRLNNLFHYARCAHNEKGHLGGELNNEHNMHIAHAQYFREGFENRLHCIYSLKVEAFNCSSM